MLSRQKQKVGGGCVCVSVAIGRISSCAPSRVHDLGTAREKPKNDSDEHCPAPRWSLSFSWNVIDWDTMVQIGKEGVDRYTKERKVIKETRVKKQDEMRAGQGSRAGVKCRREEQ